MLTENIISIYNLFGRFNNVWRDKLNWKKLIFEDVIYAEKYEEVELECRRQVDDSMRQELDLLQVCREKIYLFRILQILPSLF